MERQVGPLPYAIYSIKLTHDRMIMNPSKLLNFHHAFLADAIGSGTIRSEVLFLLPFVHYHDYLMSHFLI